ncbi:MAG: hypothetical protein L6Q95_02865 [Planctomycetes bacterium]|nr:hypothetical protein [Planctomycetota bacterium]
MRPLAFALLAVAPAFVVWLLLSSEPPPAPPRATSGEDSIARARIERLEAEVETLRGELDRVRSEIAALRGAILATAPPVGPEGKGVESYLDEYVRSFAAGAGGSEYFRLVVDAYAPALRDAILRSIGDPAAPVALRASLIGMLARAEFKGDGRVISALVDLLRTEPQLAQAAVKTLRAIGDARTGATLEAIAFDLPQPAALAAAFAAADLSVDGPNAAVARLLARAPDSLRGPLVGMLRGGDDANAVQALRDASRMDVPVRLAAAKKLGTFRGDPFRRLAEEWLGRETDAGVEAALRQALDQQTKVPNWHALKMTGPPDATPATQDNPNAWAAREQDKGPEWVELTYDPPRRASAVRIFEVYVAGGVVGIETVDESGTRRTVWKGTDPTVTPGVFEVAFAATSYRVRAVRIILDTSKRTGWEEIDAVELLGPDGRAWASGASASSSYAQG